MIGKRQLVVMVIVDIDFEGLMPESICGREVDENGIIDRILPILRNMMRRVKQTNDQNSND